MNRIIVLYTYTNTKGWILRDIKKQGIKVVHKNKNTITLEHNVIIFKSVNVNRANDLAKYKDDLILYYPGLDDEVKEIKDRCETKLNFAVMGGPSNEGVIPYLLNDSNILQKRYWAGDGIYYLNIMVNEDESEKNVISRKNIMWKKNLYLDKNDAITEYREHLKEIIKEKNEEKENLKKEYLKKIEDINSSIESYRNSIENPEFKFLNKIIRTY